MLSHRSIFGAYQAAYRPEVSDISFPSLFIWRHAFSPGLAEHCGSLCVFCQNKGQVFALPPIGPVEALPDLIPALLGHFRYADRPFHLKAVPEGLVKPIMAAFPGQLRVSSDPATWDYVYHSRDLVDLAGRKLQGRRNHLNKFLSHYEFEYLPLSNELAGECLTLDREWRLKRESEGLMVEEEQAVREALTHCEELGLRGGVIRVSGRVRAFSAGALINPDMGVVHIEKAETGIPGLYAVINQQTAEKAFGDVTWINREEDMGLPGLQQAKRAYQPARMIKKYEMVVV